MINNILYYLILQNLQARIRNAGGNLIINTDKTYTQGKTDYASIPADLKRDLTVAAQKNAEMILKENPDYFLGQHDKHGYIDVKYQDITIVQFDFFDGTENITFLCNVTPGK